jgi:hypothetical protein
MVNSPRGGSPVGLAAPRSTCAINGDENSPAAANAAAPRMKLRLQTSHMGTPCIDRYVRSPPVERLRRPPQSAVRQNRKAEPFQGTFKKADQNIKKGAIATPLSQVKAGLVAVNANDQQRNSLRANFSPRPSCLKGGIRRPVGAPGGIDCPERPPPGPPGAPGNPPSPAQILPVIEKWRDLSGTGGG